MLKRGILTGLCSLFACIAIFCAGCGYTFLGGGETEYTYENAQSYTVGGGSVGADISAIETDWVSGEIKIDYADVQYCSLFEDIGEEIEDVGEESSEDRQLRYLVDNGTLKIKYVKAGTW